MYCYFVILSIFKLASFYFLFLAQFGFANQTKADFGYINFVQETALHDKAAQGAGFAYEYIMPTASSVGVSYVLRSAQTYIPAVPALNCIAGICHIANLVDSLEQMLSLYTGHEPKIAYVNQYNPVNLPYAFANSQLEQAKNNLMPEGSFKENFDAGRAEAKTYSKIWNGIRAGSSLWNLWQLVKDWYQFHPEDKNPENQASGKLKLHLALRGGGNSEDEDDAFYVKRELPAGRGGFGRGSLTGRGRGNQANSATAAAGGGSSSASSSPTLLELMSESEIDWEQIRKAVESGQDPNTRFPKGSAFAGFTLIQSIVVSTEVSLNDIEMFKFLLDRATFEDLRQKLSEDSAFSDINLMQALVIQQEVSENHAKILEMMLDKETSKDLNQKFPENHLFAGLTLIQALAISGGNSPNHLKIFEVLLNNDTPKALNQTFPKSSPMFGRTLMQSLIVSDKPSKNRVKMFELLVDKATSKDLNQKFPKGDIFYNHTLTQALVLLANISDNHIEMFKIILNKLEPEYLNPKYPEKHTFQGFTLMEYLKIYQRDPGILKILKLLEERIAKSPGITNQKSSATAATGGMLKLLEHKMAELSAAAKRAQKNSDDRAQLEREWFLGVERIEHAEVDAMNALEIQESELNNQVRQQLDKQVQERKSIEKDYLEKISSIKSDEDSELSGILNSKEYQSYQKFKKIYQEFFLKGIHNVESFFESKISEREDVIKQRDFKPIQQDLSRMNSEKQKKLKAIREKFSETETEERSSIAAAQEEAFKSIRILEKKSHKQQAVSAQQTQDRISLLTEWAGAHKKLRTLYKEEFEEVRRIELEKAEEIWQEYVEGLLKELEGSQEEELVTLQLPPPQTQIQTASAATAASMPNAGQNDGEKIYINWKHIFEGHTGSLMQSAKSIFLPRYNKKDELKKIMLSTLEHGKPVNTDGDKVAFELDLNHGVGFTRGFQTSILTIVVLYKQGKPIIITAYPGQAFHSDAN